MENSHLSSEFGISCVIFKNQFEFSVILHFGTLSTHTFIICKSVNILQSENLFKPTAWKADMSYI